MEHAVALVGQFAKPGQELVRKQVRFLAFDEQSAQMSSINSLTLSLALGTNQLEKHAFGFTDQG